MFDLNSSRPDFVQCGAQSTLDTPTSSRPLDSSWSHRTSRAQITSDSSDSSSASDNTPEPVTEDPQTPLQVNLSVPVLQPEVQPRQDLEDAEGEGDQDQQGSEDYADMPGTDHTVPTGAETQLRFNLTSALEEAEACTLLQPVDYDSIRSSLVGFPEKLSEMQEKVYKRVAVITVAATQQQQRKDWIEFKLKSTADYRKYMEIVQDADPNYETPETIRQKQIDILKEKTKAIASTVKNVLTNLETEIGTIQAQAGYEMQRHVYDQFNGRLEFIGRNIDKDIPDLYDEILQLDPSQAQNHMTNRSTMETELANLLQKVTQKLLATPMHETTFNHPALSSTARNNSLLAPGSASVLTSQGHRITSKITHKIPRFDGSPADYPRWKKELQQDIFPGQSDTSCIRIMSEYSPIHNLKYEIEVLTEAWEHMDLLYANPQVVTQKVIPKFLDTRQLYGNNPQEKVVALFKTLRGMQLTLKSVDQLHELTSSSATIQKAISLLPNKYKEEFAHKQLEAMENSPGGVLTSGQLFQLLYDFLEARQKLFIRTGMVPPDFGESTAQSSCGESSGDEADCGSSRSKRRGRSGNSSRRRDPTAAEEQVMADTWAKWGKCPCCGEIGHKYWSKADEKWLPSSNLANCPKWTGMLVDDRVRFITTNRFCYKCTSWQHHQTQCPKKVDTWKCKVKDPVTGRPCDKFHSNYVHGTSLVLCHFDNLKTDRNTWQPGTKDDLDDDEFMLMMRQDVMLPVVATELTGLHGNVPASILLDSGSNCTVVTNELASRLGLKGRTVVQDIRVVGEEPKPVKITYYNYTFHTFKGTKKMIILGLDRISISQGNYSVAPAYRIFPHIEENTLEKPNGPIDMIIGTDYCDLLPGGGEGENLVNNLRVMNIIFGPGRVLLGSHPDISFINPQMDRHVYHLTRSFSAHSSISGLAYTAPHCTAEQETYQEIEGGGSDITGAVKAVGQVKGWTVVRAFLLMFLFFSLHTAMVGRPVEQNLPVQRIIVLLPVQEISALEPANEGLHICEDELRVPDVLHRDPSPGDPLLSPSPGPDTPTPPQGASPPPTPRLGAQLAHTMVWRLHQWTPGTSPPSSTPSPSPASPPSLSSGPSSDCSVMFGTSSRFKAPSDKVAEENQENLKI